MFLLASVNAAAQDKNFYIYLCFGQSNMESGGKMKEMDRTVDKRFQVMADADAPNRGWTKGGWYEAVPPLAAKVAPQDVPAIHPADAGRDARGTAANSQDAWFFYPEATGWTAPLPELRGAATRRAEFTAPALANLRTCTPSSP